MEMRQLTEDREVTAYERGRVKPGMEPLVTERYLRVSINGQELVRLASSPHAGQELAVGYLIGEGILEPSCYLISTRELKNDVIDVLVEGQPENYTPSIRTINTCIARGFGELKPLQKQTPSGKLFTPEQLLSLITELDEKSYIFKRTGGVHSAGLGAPQGLLQRFEDIGRHNAVDKVFGYACLNRVPLQDKCLVLSGRVAYEILQKAAYNQIPVILSRSAPTLLTVDRARELGITVVGFARGDRFNVYSHQERICFD